MVFTPAFSSVPIIGNVITNVRIPPTTCHPPQKVKAHSTVWLAVKTTPIITPAT